MDMQGRMLCRKVYGWAVGLGLCAALAFSGCSAMEEEPKVADVDYTVLSPYEIPKELADEIAQVGNKEFQYAYDDGEYLYIAKGYGKRETSGYDITVQDVYVTEHHLVLSTDLSGPGEGEEVAQHESHPYIVIKTENVDKQVVFQ